jgi:hypothetical protein
MMRDPPSQEGLRSEAGQATMKDLDPVLRHSINVPEEGRKFRDRAAG